MAFKWVDNPQRFSTGKLCMLGKVSVASVYWEQGSRGEIDRKPWAVLIHMPGMAHPTQRYGTQEAAQERAERALKTWFEWAGLNVPA